MMGIEDKQTDSQALKEVYKLINEFEKGDLLCNF